MIGTMSAFAQIRLASLSYRYLTKKVTHGTLERCRLLHHACCFSEFHPNRLEQVSSQNCSKLSKAILESKQRFITPLALDTEAYSHGLAHETGLTNVTKVIRPLAIYPKIKSVVSYYEHYYHDRTSGSKNILTLAATLALLGIFKESIDGDIEHEKARLSDTEKWEKMEPFDRKIAIGVLYMSDQEYTRADRLFHEALMMAQDDNNEEQEELVLNLIATNYFESGDWDKAEKLFIDLIKKMIAHDTPTTAPAILELSLKLASIYSKTQATHEKAMKGFKFVINSLLFELDDLIHDIENLDISNLSDEKKNTIALLGWSYDWFAKHLLASNDYNGAADMLQRALQISSKILGQLHDQTLILLNDIGTTLAMNNAPEEGRSFIERAVEGAIETQSKELASFYVNLGLVNLKLKRLHDAKRYCEYSIELVGKNREQMNNSHEVIELSKSCLNEAQRLIEASNK